MSTQPHSDNSRPNPWLSLFAWLLPTSSLKTWALRKLGNEISDDTIIGPNLVIGCGRAAEDEAMR